MSCRHCFRLVSSASGWALTLTGLCSTALAQTASEPVLGPREVTARNVYVRSGNSLNHYPVCKLDAGDRVTVVAEHGEWCEVLPPEEAFSWISAQYVDSVDNESGVVNGDNVRVRAGSSLPQWAKSRYTVQTKLNKGAAVTILDTSPDGFLRIKPPQGATLWISRAYLDPVPESRLSAEGDVTEPIQSETPAEAGPVTSAAEPQAGTAPDRPVETATSPNTSPFQAVPPTQERRALEAIDTVTRAELNKPIHERQFGTVLERYREIAQQNEDDFARRYAETRIAQINHMVELIDAAGRMRRLNDETESRRRALLDERMSMNELVVPTPSGLDARGELRASAVYPPGTTPRRYRLVDPRAPKGRTIGYVEIPPDADLNVDDYLGRYVGVRVSATRFQSGSVDPVPIYVVRELVLLPSEEESSGLDDPG